MELQDKPDPRQAQILPVVRYSATRKAEKAADYWDYATLLELAVLADDHDDADDQLSEAIGVARAAWRSESTARNLGLIRQARHARGEDAAWIEALEAELGKAAKALAVPSGEALRPAEAGAAERGALLEQQRLDDDRHHIGDLDHAADVDIVELLELHAVDGDHVGGGARSRCG